MRCLKYSVISVVWFCVSLQSFSSLAGPIEDFNTIRESGRTPVLVIIDAETMYFHNNDALDMKVSNNISQTVKYAGENNIRIINITQTDSVQDLVLSELIKTNYESYKKGSNSAFTRLSSSDSDYTKGLLDLVDPQTDTLLVQGVADGCCVIETVSDALKNDIPVYVNRSKRTASTNQIIEKEWRDLQTQYSDKLKVNEKKPRVSCTR